MKMRVLLAAITMLVIAAVSMAQIPPSLGWYQIPNTKISSVYDPTYSNMDQTNIVRAWNSGVFDTLRNRLIVWGGGHGDYWGNEIYSLNLNSLTMTRLNNTTVGGCSQDSCDGNVTPNSRHTYDGIEYMPNIDRMFVYGGSVAGSGSMSTQTWTFNFATLQWQKMFPANQPADPTPSIFTAYDPNTQKIFLSNASSLWSYTFATNNYQLLGDAHGLIFYEFNGVIDPVRKKMFVFGGGDHSVFDISGNGSYDRQTFNSTGGSAVENAKYPGLAYDPVTDRIVSWVGGDSVYSLDVDTATWTQITYPGGPGPADQHGSMGRWNYSPALGVFVIVNSTTQNAYTLRLSNGTPPPADTQAPSIPTNLTAVPASSSQINLTWTASTDNVGVTGYELERCQGSGCSSFLQIATPTATTYADNGLAGSTSYSYRIRALDAVSNRSTYSAVASATTLANPPPSTLPLGPLTHDGPATPEQLSLLLPVTGTLPQTATATVRYKPAATSTWLVGHMLFRIQPSYSLSPPVGTVDDAFAWPIIDLIPGTSYNVEVTVTSGTTTDVKTATFTTRALPAAAGVPNKTITAGSSTATIQSALDSLNPGDVLQFQSGTYALSGNLTVNRSGTVASPIYIRGASRTGVVLSNPNRIFQIQNAANVVFENFTIQGSGVDSGVNATSAGISFSNTVPDQSRITIRNITMTGVDVGISNYGGISEALIYDNTFTGNNVWQQSSLETNATWNDDGIALGGTGNCAFNNTLTGFGDTLSYNSPGSDLVDSIGVHFYRNDVRNSGDDLVEADEGHRNDTLYDNRSHNSMTFLSLDELYGGPFLAVRNIAINIGRAPYKLNAQNSGHFIYNNTLIRTNGFSSGASWGWNQSNNGGQRAWGFQNNILIYQGTGKLMALESGPVNPLDFTHNSWFPNSEVWWSATGGSFATLAAAYAGLSATTPVFSGQTKRHEQDNITVVNPWTTAVTLGANYLTEITATYTPTLAGSTAPKNSGIAIANVTDGFSGTAPDRGAIIAGRPIPIYGDRSTLPPPPTTTFIFCANENEQCVFTGTKEVRFGANGFYLYKTATDGIACTRAAFGGDPIVETVKQCHYRDTVTTPTNQPPVTNAGPDQTITLPATVSLTGTVTDDGLPSGALTYQWTGPAGVTFASPQALSTQVTFSAAGSFTLTLTASDGALSSSATVLITVNATPPPADPCVSDPLTITGVKWPTAQTGTRSITYNSGNKKVETILFTWPGTLQVTDDRNCTATVMK